MSKVYFYALFGFILSFFIVTSSWADYDDFIDEDDFKRRKEYCNDSYDGCYKKCEAGKKSAKCNKKCLKAMKKCYLAATKNAIKVSQLPPEAQKLYKKIEKRQTKALIKCQDDNWKRGKKCEKKHFGPENYPKYRKCMEKNKSVQKFDNCVDKANAKHTFKTKKMAKLLKGKKP